MSRKKTRSFALACRPRKSWPSQSGPEELAAGKQHTALRKRQSPASGCKTKKRRGEFRVSVQAVVFGRLLLIYVGENRSAAGLLVRPNNKNPEVMLVSFVSASSSLLDPRRPALVAALRVATRDLGSGSGLTANRINQSNASGLYLAFNGRSCSPCPAF